MAKSMRFKREKRMRAIRREMVEPFYDNKDQAKLAAQEAAVAAPKLPVKPSNASSSAMEVDDNRTDSLLKPFGGIVKKSKMVFKVGKRRLYGKGKGSKVKKRHI